MNQLPKEVASLIEAAKNLLDACFAADEAEELDARIDGSLLDAVSNALDTLAAPSDAQVNVAAPGTRGVEAKAVEASEPAAATPAPEPVATYHALCDIWQECNALGTVLGDRERLQKKIAALRDEVGAQSPAPEVREALDSARLDWLAKNGGKVQWGKGYLLSPDAWAYLTPNGHKTADDLREAIDACRAVLSKGDAK